ncbi:guanine nucleotide-binding protein subunit gamma 2 [Neltuma alba]|uniref:guanine nucleotide-binding protein subunit gamma 2 n=1 Tax=Neltuma alba TaxID=207710 RepID=UPI0010A48A23|nr:guanine nucleotide-binding protein subunit gamma 2-like [Prosopis alba]
MDDGIVQPLAEGSKAENGGITDNYRQQAATTSTQPRGAESLPAFVGKHRLQAAISQLNNEINIIEGELEQLETMGESSSVCKELISRVESIPDPLLPWIQGSVDGGWDRWFGGAHHSRSHKRWI